MFTSRTCNNGALTNELRNEDVKLTLTSAPSSDPVMP
jgi:hypothetical protein